MSGSPIQIFEYLLALKNLTVPVIRDIKEYHDKLWWQVNLPIGEGCHLYEDTKEGASWLEVYRQKIELVPLPPNLISEWIKEPGMDPARLPEVYPFLNLLSLEEKQELIVLRSRLEKLKAGEQNVLGENVKEDWSLLTRDIKQVEEKIAWLTQREKVAFEADVQRVVLWDNWFHEQWEPWAQETLPKMKVQELYGEFFTLYQRLQREGESVELIWGHHNVTWLQDGFRIQRPLFTTRMELLFDANHAVFQLIPVSTGTAMEIDMLSGIEVPNATHLLTLVRSMQETGLDPWDTASIRSGMSEFVELLSPNGLVKLDRQYAGTDLIPREVPVVYRSSVLFIRSRSGRQWHSEFQSIIENLRAGNSVTEPIRVLAMMESMESDDSLNQSWHSIGEDLLFPLPANEDQKDIVRRLSRQFGVVVQGPPGTGKSHTIVNLIAHLLAHGKRILVTSQTERALRVLGNMIQDKLPDIAPLCVSVLGGDSRSIKELEASVTKISEGLDSIHEENAVKQIDVLQEQLNSCRKTIANIKMKLSHIVQAEHQLIDIGNRNLTTLQVAEWLAANEVQYGWLPDIIQKETKLPLTEEEVTLLYELLMTIDPKDRKAVSQYRPSLSEVVTVEYLHIKFNKMLKWNNRKLQVSKQLNGWTLLTQDRLRVKDDLKTAYKAYESLNFNSAHWLNKILDDVIHGGQRKIFWENFTDDCNARIRDIRENDVQLAEYHIEFPATIDQQQSRADLYSLIEEFEKNNKPGFLYRHFSGKKTLYILKQFRINDALPRTSRDLQLLLLYLENHDLKQRLVQKWNTCIGEVSGPAVEWSSLGLLSVLEAYMEQIHQIFQWELKCLPELQQITEKITPCGILSWHKLAWLQSFIDGLQAYDAELEYKNEQQELESIVRYLKTGMVHTDTHESWGILASALEHHDEATWQEVYVELQRLVALEAKVDVLDELSDKLKSIAPLWLQQIEQQALRGQLNNTKDWQKAWEWKQTETWLQQHLATVCPEMLYEQLHDRKTAELYMIQQLVSLHTWVAQNRRTTNVQKRSLRAWIQAIRRIGKGTGKYAAKHRADATREMVICREAVPVWIMPLNRVIENIQPTEEPFDVVIVDESSQCDLFALSALFRAKRVVIVGDDKQISPEGVGRDQGEINSLIERHLVGIPQRQRFTLQDSLYDTALRVFPGQHIVLKEHFRCVPEIIQFSNDRFYGGVIEPLRIPNAKERLDPAVVAVRVDQGYREDSTAVINEPEANLLVAKIVELCDAYGYENKTMGVISLQGREQAYLIEQKLREAIGEAEMINRKFVCGDAYSFQGDERDVMFLSMVAAPNRRIGILNKRTDEQRFNVAASRAREQMWLFHSVDLSDLNPQCMRYQLLQYCLDPQRTQMEMEEAEEIFKRYASSQFHKDVYQMIVARGYRAIPEFKVGTYPYRIDIVIEGVHSRLAVECDGDVWHGLEQWEADLERQTVLERVGWKFWRVRGSTFYRNRAVALEPLWELLQSMEIEPRN